MATAPTEAGPDKVWIAFMCFVSVAMAVILGRVISPSTVPLAPLSVPPLISVHLDPVPSVVPATWQGKPTSAWRRAYILKHGHQPPAPRE